MAQNVRGVSSKGLNYLFNPTEHEWRSNPYEKQGVGNNPVLFEVNEEIPKLEDLHLKYAQKAKGIFSGRNRNTFVLNDRLVVKLPRNFDGFTDNDWEGSVSNTVESCDNPDYVQYPKTKLVYVQEIPVVFMQYVLPLTSKEIINLFLVEPDWVASVDCGQVGITRFGRLVAYDYGLR